LEQLTGVETRRMHVDKGYRGHNHKEKLRVWITGQVTAGNPFDPSHRTREPVRPL
jgi:hypothetical protein